MEARDGAVGRWATREGDRAMIASGSNRSQPSAHCLTWASTTDLAFDGGQAQADASGGPSADMEGGIASF